MKRIAILLLSTLTLLTLLTGCYPPANRAEHNSPDFGIKLNADGTGSVSARIGIDKDVYNQALGMGAELFGDSEAEPTEYEYKGKTYVSVTETTEYASFDELKQALLDLTYETEELAQLNDLEAAVDAAIDRMPGEYQIKAFLIENRAEVKRMCITEFNEDRLRRADRREGIDIGIEIGEKKGRKEGRAEGRKEGRAEGETLLSTLIKKLIARGAYDDVDRAASDPEYRNKLYHDYGLA